MFKELTNEWILSGVAKGDTILIHSNIKRTLIKWRRQGYKIYPLDILESFISAVGSEGTVIIPTFNFDFPTSNFFDIRNTPSQMGSLTEVARHHKDAIRTGHPIYSFAVIGKNAHLFKALDNESGYGVDSPFGILRKLNGKIASLDLTDQNSMTFYHHIEEMKAVNYRYFKEFTGEYINLQGIKSTKTYKLFVRDIEKGVITNVNPAGEMMWESKIYTGYRPMTGPGLRTVSAGKMFQFVSNIIDNDKALGNLYTIKDQE